MVNWLIDVALRNRFIVVILNVDVGPRSRVGKSASGEQFVDDVPMNVGEAVVAAAVAVR